MNVIIGCEFSGIVREEFEKRGHFAVSCDLRPTEKPGRHYQGDIFDLLDCGVNWDLGIFFPPCTRLCNSGVRWLEERNLWREMRRAAKFFRRLMDADIPKVAGENPVMHGYAKAIVGPPTQYIQPYEFGHRETKKTGLWIRGLPPLRPTRRMKPPFVARVHNEAPGPDREKNRSRTYTGIARAMAQQWGDL